MFPWFSVQTFVFVRPLCCLCPFVDVQLSKMFSWRLIVPQIRSFSGRRHKDLSFLHPDEEVSSTSLRSCRKLLDWLLPLSLPLCSWTVSWMAGAGAKRPNSHCSPEISLSPLEMYVPFEAAVVSAPLWRWRVWLHSGPEDLALFDLSSLRDEKLNI